jgi:hypothetical protein
MYPSLLSLSGTTAFGAFISWLNSTPNQKELLGLSSMTDSENSLPGDFSPRYLFLRAKNCFIFLTVASAAI